MTLKGRLSKLEAAHAQPVVLWDALPTHLQPFVSPEVLQASAGRLLLTGEGESVRHDAPALALLAYLQGDA